MSKMKIFDIDQFREIWQAISRNKTRSVLTGFGVLWGIFMYIVMMGLGIGFQNGIQGILGNFAANSLIVYPNQTTVEYKGFNSGRSWSLTSDDITMLVDNIPAINRISPMLFAYAEKTTRGEYSGDFSLQGVGVDYFYIDAKELTQGRYFNKPDIDEKRKVCVIEEKVVTTLFPHGEDPIGQRIEVDGIFFTVVGVAKAHAMFSIGGESGMTIYLPYSTIQQMYNSGKEIHILALSVKDDVNITDIESEVTALLKAKHVIAPSDDVAVGTQNVQRMFNAVSYLFLGLKILIWVVGMGTLFAGVVGVSNIMLVSIRERTQEIGIKRALGAKPFSIIASIMSESILLTFIAGFFGLFFGVLVLVAVGKVTENMTEFFVDPVIPFSLAITVSLIILFMGALAGIIPARSAMKVKAIEAIRDE